MLAAIIIIICTVIRTFSFGIWTWKKKNKLGAIMVFAVAIAAFFFPLYVMLFVEI